MSLNIVKRMGTNLLKMERLYNMEITDKEIVDILHQDFPDVYNKIIDYINMINDSYGE